LKAEKPIEENQLLSQLKKRRTKTEKVDVSKQESQENQQKSRFLEIT